MNAGESCRASAEERWGAIDQIILIKGGGDIGTAVAIRLHKTNRQVVIAESPGAPTLRRAISFGAAIDQGEVVVEGVRSRPSGTAADTKALLSQQIVPVWTAGWKSAIDLFSPKVLVDARMVKRLRNSETRIDHAPLVIGLGPGFIAGQEVHLVIETNHGSNLGRVIREGAAEPHTGIPRRVQGYGEERYFYAPTDGMFVSKKDIGARVEANELIGQIGKEALRSRFRGIVRGIVKSGTMVRQGQKVVDLDPREDESVVRTFTDRANRIADAVLLAVERWEQTRD